jgi:iron complex outermembrane receptor protein
MFQRTKICSGLLLAFGSSLLSVAPGAFAQDTTVQRVEITGSSIKRVDAETSVPVTVITAEEFKKAGVTSTEQLLQQVSSMQVQQTSAQAVGASTGGASYADMRGLGANKTLVLLNGRRIANSAFSASAVDINTIPFAAIERVEILRDGASALYGTDAIAGVINFITRKDYRGGTITLGLDTPQHPGGSQHEAQAGFGFGDLDKDGLNIFGFVGFQKQAEISASQRHYFPHIQTSGTTFPGTYLYTDAAGKSEYYTPFAAPACTAADRSLIPVKNSTTQCGEDTGTFVDYIPASQRLTGYGKATFKIDSANTFAFEAYVAQSKVNSKIAPVPYGALYMSPTSPYYPGNGITPLPPGYTNVPPNQLGDPGAPNNSDIFVKYRDLFNGYREDDNTTTQGRFSAILEGTIADWDYDVAATLNQTRAQDFLAHGYSDIDTLATYDSNPNSATYTGYILNPAINPFGAQSAAGAAILSAAQKNGVLQYGTGTVQDLDGHASRELGDWLHAGRPAAIAVGFEARHEKFLQQANTAFAEEVVASTGVDPNTYNAGARKVYAVYSELNIPVLKSLDITGALRYDHYSDFGSTTNPKVSFRFEPSKQVLFRGSYSTGFRAPSLYELHAAQTYGNSTSGQNDPVNCPNGVLKAGAPTTACDNQFEVLAGGNTGLKAEKSKNATLGMVLEPINNVTAEFDLYSILITKEVGTLPDSTLFSPAGYAEFPGNFHYNAAGQLSTDGTQCPGANCGYVEELNQNLGSVRTNGMDIALGYKLNAGAAGRFNFDLQSTWVHSYKYQLVPGGESIQNVGIFSNGSPVFRWQHNGTIGWTYNQVSLGWAVHYKAGYVDFSGTRSVSPYTTMDLYGTYAMAKGFTFTAGVKNLTDSKAPYTDYTGLFQTGYDPRYADPTGRTYYGRATYSF